MLNKYLKKECIPVECVPPALIAATIGHHCPSPEEEPLPLGGRPPHPHKHTPPCWRQTPRKNIGPGSQTGSDIMPAPPVDRMTDRHL